MDENSKANATQKQEEKAKELTTEELNKVAGGSAQPGVGSPSQPRQAGWIEINSFQWGGE